METFLRSIVKTGLRASAQSASTPPAGTDGGAAALAAAHARACLVDAALAIFPFCNTLPLHPSSLIFVLKVIVPFAAVAGIAAAAAGAAVWPSARHAADSQHQSIMMK